MQESANKNESSKVISWVSCPLSEVSNLIVLRGVQFLFKLKEFSFIALSFKLIFHIFSIEPTRAIIKDGRLYCRRWFLYQCSEEIE